MCKLEELLTATRNGRRSCALQMEVAGVLLNVGSRQGQPLYELYLIRSSSTRRSTSLQEQPCHHKAQLSKAKIIVDLVVANYPILPI